ncbi:quinone oxidoreductase family protein [Natronomonas sp.]|uniref:quinone oxidoreductase family protein n=1 Tax=Natronomonas sp. TaxID=2184060 RepID=UPI00262BD9D3|nr:NADPH:quinone reductase [Natronomonas sp.]
MYAVRHHEAGGPEVLRYESIDRPEPGPGEVLVEVRAASVNPVDAKLRAVRDPDSPKTTGSDLAGVVAAVGQGVSAHAVGDRVFATGLHSDRFRGGSFAEYAAVPTDLLAALPDAVSFEDGAALALVGVTAWRAFVTHAGVSPGTTAFVHGANGGVGHVAVGLADAMGASVVGTARPTYHDDVRALGADAVFDYGREDLSEAVEDAVGDADAVLDHMPETYLGFDVDVAAFGGSVVVIADGAPTVPDTLPARSKELAVQFMSMSNLIDHSDLPDVGPILERLAAAKADGRFEVLIDRSYPLEEGADAHRAVMDESVLGKILVVP